MKYKLEKPVHGLIARKKYECIIEWRNGKFIADEPETVGGEDTSPDPYTLLLSSLTSCKLITLRMYIDRKGWEIDNIGISANLCQETKAESTTTIMDCDILFLSPVSEEQKMRLLEIAKNCPVSKIIQGDLKVRVFAFRDGDTKTIKYANEEITVLWNLNSVNIPLVAGPNCRRYLCQPGVNGLFRTARPLKESVNRWQGVLPVRLSLCIATKRSQRNGSSYL